MSLPVVSRLGTFGDEIIDACIADSKTLTTEINDFYRFLNENNAQFFNLDQSNEEIRQRYDLINKSLGKITYQLKPAAYERCNKMKYEDAAKVKNALDAATGALKQRHRYLVGQIVEMVHENKLRFPISSPPPKCWCSSSRNFLVQNKGWIASGCAASIAVLTLTSLGEQLGPVLAQLPKYFGNKCNEFGEYFTAFLSSETVKNMAQSPWAPTVGKLCLVPALGYPTYRYLKEPITKWAKIAFEKLDKATAKAAEDPMKTFLASWAIYYIGGRMLGFEGHFAGRIMDPFHARLATTFGAAFLTPAAISGSRVYIDAYKKKVADSALKQSRIESPPAPVSSTNPAKPASLPTQSSQQASPPKSVPNPEQVKALRKPWLDRLETIKAPMAEVDPENWTG